MVGKFNIAKKQIRYSTSFKGRAFHIVSEKSYVRQRDM